MKERPADISAKGQRVGERLSRAIFLDHPGKNRSDSQSGDQRDRAGPCKRVRSKHGYHDKKANQRAKRSQNQRQHRVGVKFPDMLRQGSEGEEKVAHDAAPPAELLFEEHGESVGHSRPAERVIVDVRAVSPQQRLMGQEPVFALSDRDAEPVAGTDGRLDLEQ